MNFLQFFVWGAWMMTLGHYGFVEKEWNGAEFGLVFSTMGFASLIMPTLFGIIADKWKANYVYAILHLLFGATMCVLPFIDAPVPFFWVLWVKAWVQAYELLSADLPKAGRHVWSGQGAGA